VLAPQEAVIDSDDTGASLGHLRSVGVAVQLQDTVQYSTLLYWYIPVQYSSVCVLLCSAGVVVQLQDTVGNDVKEKVADYQRANKEVRRITVQYNTVLFSEGEA